MRKKTFPVFASAVALVFAIQMPATYAESLSELKNEKSEIESQKNELKSQINEKSSEINVLEDKQNQLIAQISNLNNEISKTDNEIAAVETEITEATEKIETLKKEIKALEEKIEQRDKLLEERARALQANGSVSYIDVLLGANSFVDFIDRFSAVNTLMDADRQIIKEQKEDQEKLDQQKVTVEKTKDELESNKSRLESLKSSLDSQKAEKDRLVKELEQEQTQISSEKQQLEEHYEEAVEISDEINAQIAAEQKRLLEIARQQELQKKKEAENAKKNNSSNSGSSNSGSSNSGSSNSGSAPAVSSGNWTKPANGRYSSPYGVRIHPITGERKMHYGIDLSNSTGTPIVAAADGVVSYAAPLSTYGNVVMITHSIDGQIFTSLYAHLSSIHVSVGTQVSKGQHIAAMGSTGASTGPHLHFEIHIGTWVRQSVGSVNPLNYIPL
ncbi:murein hydrolase activator EnvC family protein [Ureibacillus sp. FSL E2-3493]|uniref:murein hydrolase activator EnvC family protein n=1 Tax=Ureibacillus sp. FSL E2-3493 TaxID=2921367 RepID=UPI00311917D5